MVRLSKHLEIGSSPHVTDGASTDVIMRNVFFALLPVTVFAAGWQTFTVADLDSSGITGGASREIEVTPGAYERLLLLAPGEEAAPGAEDLALRCFEQCMESGAVIDGVISQSEAQAKGLWSYREGIAEAVTPYTPYLYDTSVRISEVPAYLEQHGLPLPAQGSD